MGENTVKRADRELRAMLRIRTRGGFGKRCWWRQSFSWASPLKRNFTWYEYRDRTRVSRSCLDERKYRVWTKNKTTKSWKRSCPESICVFVHSNDVIVVCWGGSIRLVLSSFHHSYASYSVLFYNLETHKHVKHRYELLESYRCWVRTCCKGTEWSSTRSMSSGSALWCCDGDMIAVRQRLEDGKRIGILLRHGITERKSTSHCLSIHSTECASVFTRYCCEKEQGCDTRTRLETAHCITCSMSYRLARGCSVGISSLCVFVFGYKHLESYQVLLKHVHVWSCDELVSHPYISLHPQERSKYLNFFVVTPRSPRFHWESNKSKSGMTPLQLCRTGVRRLLKVETNKIVCATEFIT